MESSDSQSASSEEKAGTDTETTSTPSFLAGSSDTDSVKSTVGTAGKTSDDSAVISNVATSETTAPSNNDASSVIADPAAGTPVPQKPQLTDIKYVFEENDSLFDLFLRFHVSVSNIRRWNFIVSSPYVGQVLHLKVLQ